MMGQSAVFKGSTDRSRLPLSICPWIQTVPYALLLAVLLSTVAVSSSGLAPPLPDSERPKYRTAYACEGSTLNMDCDHGHVINLIRANYGRFSITICNEHGNTEWSVNCMSLRSHRVLHDRCSQRQNCSVPASTRGFGDPCPGTLKYLEAHFQCVPVNPPSNTARPRPPWFLAAKTTVSTLTEDRLSPHHDSPFPRDPPQGGMFPEMPPPEGAVRPEEGLKGVESDSVKSSSSTTTTTLRPPPWLITNVTKNITTSTTSTTTTTTTLHTTVATSPTTSQTSAGPLEHGVSPSGEGDTSFTPTTPPAPLAPPVGVKGTKTYATNGLTDNEDRQDEDGQKRRVITSTLSTTTLWSPQAEVPEQNIVEEASWCPPTSGRGLFWNWTRSGKVAAQPCPGGASGWATRPCAPRGWVSPPDLGECRSVWLSSLLTRAEAKDAVLAVAQDLTQVTQSRKLYGGDITAAARLVSELTRRMGDDVSSFPDGAQLEALVTELVVKALTTVSNLVGRQKPAWGDLRPSEHNAALTQLLLGLEEAAFFLADNIHHEKTITHGVPNILMRLQVLETRNVGPVTFPSPDDPWPAQELTDPPYQSNPYSEDGDAFALPASELPTTTPSPLRHLQDFITLPPEALLENSDNGLVKMVFFSYEGLQHLLQPERSYGYIGEGYQKLNRTRILNSRVVSASLGAGRHIELSEPVYVTFAMIRTTNVTNPSCVFWDYTTSSWSEEGCRVLMYNTSHATCECDHLTNFAVLMDIHATPLASSHQVALSVITYVGCVISIVGLLLATVVFHAFRGLKNDRTTIHKNLCVCLLLGEAIFVGGISRTDQPLVCGFVAGFLHYFFLAAFAWMFFEGFQLYVMLIEVFEAEKSRVRWYYASAYGFPAIVVAISAVVDPYSYGTETVCWLRTDNYFIFAFVGPALAVILANCVFLTLSMIRMCRHAENSAVLKNKETSSLNSLRSWIRGAVVLTFLLGLTWTFGLLYLNEATVAMAYVFTVLNSLQGLFIFVFHCLQNDKVKKEAKRLCRRHTWLRACLCYSRSHSTPTTASTKTDARNSQLAPSLGPSQTSNSVGTFCGAVQHTGSNCLCGDMERVSLHHNAQASSSSSSDCPSSSHSLTAEGVRATYNLPVLHHPEPNRDYQNALPLHIQQLHAAQIYATPPSTPPISELYDIANPPHLFVAPNKHIFQCKGSPSHSAPLNIQQENFYVETHCCAQRINACPHARPHTSEVISINPPFLKLSRGALVQPPEINQPVLALHNYHNLSEYPSRPSVSLEEDESNYLRPKYHFSSTSSHTNCPHSSNSVPTVPAPYPSKSSPHSPPSAELSENPHETWQGEDQADGGIFVGPVASQKQRWQHGVFRPSSGHPKGRDFDGWHDRQFAGSQFPGPSLPHQHWVANGPPHPPTQS